jgi:hypothetical protein
MKTFFVEQFKREEEKKWGEHEREVWNGKRKA